MKDALFDSIAAGSDFEVGSPHWLIRRLQDRSNRAFKRLLGIFGKGRKFGFLFALSLLSLIFLSFELRNSAQFSGSPEGRFIFLAYARSSLPALFVLFLYAVLDLCGLEKLRKPRAGPAVLMLLALLAWYTWRKALSVFLMESFFVALVILLLLVLDWLQTRRADRRLRFSTVLGSFLGLLLLWWLMVAFLADRATVRILSIAPEKFLFPVVVFW